jgi:exosortase family protein XrtF
LNKKLIRFLITAVLLYVGWYLIYQFYIEPHTKIDYFINTKISAGAVFILEAFGMTTAPFEESYHVIVGLADSFNAGVWIGNECNGLKLFSIFSIFIIAFPGDWKKKLWFVPMGILIIHILNILRVVALVLINHYRHDALEFNHTYTFTFLMYLIIFGLWYIWVNKYGIKAFDVKKK